MRRGYAGVALILLFSFSVCLFFLLFPDVRFYKDQALRLESCSVEVFSPKFVDCDDFLSAGVLSLGVPEHSVGLSYDDFGVLRKSEEIAEKLRRAAASWKFSGEALGSMFVPVSNGKISALLPALSDQIERGYVSPNILVVAGDVGDLRRVWTEVSNYLMSQTDISLTEVLW